MSALAAIGKQAAVNPPQSEQKQPKPRKVSKRIRHAVDLLVSGECKLKKDAAAKANISPERLSRAMKESHVLAYLEQQTRVLLAQSQAPAAATMLRLLESAGSEHVQKDVAIHLLGIAGHKPINTQQVSVSVDVRAGFVIDLSEPDRKTIDVSPTRD